jgi:hypothetical protein
MLTGWFIFSVHFMFVFLYLFYWTRTQKINLKKQTKTGISLNKIFRVHSSVSRYGKKTLCRCLKHDSIKKSQTLRVKCKYKMSCIQTHTHIYIYIHTDAPGMLLFKITEEWCLLCGWVWYIQIFKCAQTGIANLRRAKLSPDKFKTWLPHHMMELGIPHACSSLPPHS